MSEDNNPHCFSKNGTTGELMGSVSCVLQLQLVIFQCPFNVFLGKLVIMFQERS